MCSLFHFNYIHFLSSTIWSKSYIKRISFEYLSLLSLWSDCFLNNIFPHTSNIVKEAATTSFPCLKNDPAAPKHLPRTRTKDPAQRRWLTSVLYLQTTVHRHSPRKPLASFHSPARRAVLAWRRAPAVARLLSGPLKRRRRDLHPTELYLTSVNRAKLHIFWCIVFQWQGQQHHPERERETFPSLLSCGRWCVPLSAASPREGGGKAALPRERRTTLNWPELNFSQLDETKR